MFRGLSLFPGEPSCYRVGGGRISYKYSVFAWLLSDFIEAPHALLKELGA